MRSIDSVISDEIRARQSWLVERAFYWIAEYRWPFHVVLVRWFGDRDSSHRTGDEVRLTIPRFWLLKWQTKRARRCRNRLPQAVLRKANALGGRR